MESVAKRHYPSTRFEKRKLVQQAPLAQLDRASDYESEGRAFESLRERHINQGVAKVAPFSFPAGVYFGVYFRAW